MSCTPKNKTDKNIKDELVDADDYSSAENPSADVWQRDIENHDYYYDDAHGYEVYNPEKEEETDED